MGTLKGFPNPPALWLRWANPTYANALIGILGRSLTPPRALWLRRTKLGSANAILILEGLTSP